MTVMRLLGLLLALLLITPVFAGYPTASWEGLVGLYTLPTAETLPREKLGVTFSEIRFSENNDETELLDKWFEESLTYSPFPRWEVAVSLRHEILTLDPVDGGDGQRFDETNVLGHVKYIITPVEPNKVGIAVGALDILGAGDELNGADLDRGRRLFLVGSYNWAHLGVTHDESGLGAAAGARISLTDSIDVITEWSTRPIFAHTDPRPSNPINFNLGVRLYPREIPGLRADIVAVGDGEFNLGFSFSYLLSL